MFHRGKRKLLERTSSKRLLYAPQPAIRGPFICRCGSLSSKKRSQSACFDGPPQATKRLVEKAQTSSPLLPFQPCFYHSLALSHHLPPRYSLSHSNSSKLRLQSRACRHNHPFVITSWTKKTWFMYSSTVLYPDWIWGLLPRFSARRKSHPTRPKSLSALHHRLTSLPLLPIRTQVSRQRQ